MGVRRSVATLLLAGAGLFAQKPVGNPPYVSPFQHQDLTDGSADCKPCHARQYFEMKQAVHSGYRNVSPMFNGLEIAGNFLTGGLLRPRYSVHNEGVKQTVLADGTTLNSNMFTTPVLKDPLQADAGFCYTCHQALMIRRGDNTTDTSSREVPEIDTGKDFRPDLLRPLRDYHASAADGSQVLPLEPGGLFPADDPKDSAACRVVGFCGPSFGGAKCGDGGCGPSIATLGITCDSCHIVGGPDLDRSFQHDGFGNMSLILNSTKEKVGQFTFPVAPNAGVHVASNDPAKINFLNNAAFCNACHDVRVPRPLPGDLQHKEANINPGGENVSYFRLENLSTEWQTGPFSGTNNPFGQVIICHDCHTSLFPFSPTSTYTVGDMTVTVASPADFPQNFAASNGKDSSGNLHAEITCDDSNGNPIGVGCDPPLQSGLDPDLTTSTANSFPLQKREVSSHYFTGVDIPLMDWGELVDRLGDDFSDPLSGSTGIDSNGNKDSQPVGSFCTPSRLANGECGILGSTVCDEDGPCPNEYGQPRALKQRREALLKNAVRVSLQHTDTTARLGGTLVVRVEAMALTGHRFPGGLSQERTTYIQLDVTDDNGFKVYQSGYVVDKPHPQTGENAPDGNLDDEDLENVHIVADPGHHTAVYQPGPETNGHTNQVIEEGPDSGPEERVFFGEDQGLVLFRNELQKIFLPGEKLGRKDADGKDILATKPHLEESTSADLNNTVDNYRSLQPLHPRTFRYNITLPTQQELAEIPVTLKGPLHVHAQVNYEHFPPMTVRFVIRTTGAEGPSGHDMHLFSEEKLDKFVRNIKDIAHDDFTVNLQ